MKLSAQLRVDVNARPYCTTEWEMQHEYIVKSKVGSLGDLGRLGNGNGTERNGVRL
jgi:hypothetical protein